MILDGQPLLYLYIIEHYDPMIPSWNEMLEIYNRVVKTCALPLSTLHGPQRQSQLYTRLKTMGLINKERAITHRGRTLLSILKQKGYFGQSKGLDIVFTENSFGAINVDLEDYGWNT